jgi:hypothetical protein
MQPRGWESQGYRNQAVVDLNGKGKKARRIPWKTETLLATQETI